MIIEPIKKQDLVILLQDISKYQDLIKGSASHSGGVIQRLFAAENHEDVSSAIEAASPLALLFTGLALLTNDSALLTQEHLDILNSDLHSLRSRAFHTLHQGQNPSIERLHQARLMQDIPGAAQNTNISQGKEAAESYYHLNILLAQLAVTPLEEVKKMIGEITADKTKTSAAAKYGSPFLDVPSSNPTPNAPTSYGSRGNVAADQPPTSKGEQQENKKQSQSDELALRIALIMQMWHNDEWRRQIALREKNLLGIFTKKRKKAGQEQKQRLQDQGWHL